MKLTVTEAARSLGMTQEYIRKCCQDGRIPSRKRNGKFQIDQQDLSAWRESVDAKRKVPDAFEG